MQCAVFQIQKRHMAASAVEKNFSKNNIDLFTYILKITSKVKLLINRFDPSL